MRQIFFCAALFFASPLSHAQKTPQPPATQTAASLVSADVIAFNQKAGHPVTDLQRDDFLIFDNNATVGIETFIRGADSDIRPVTLWLVVACNDRSAIPEVPEFYQSREKRSASFANKERLFRPALNQLAKDDRVGIAHWCENGDASVDLPPSSDPDLAIATLGKVLQPINFTMTSLGDLDRGELACRHMLYFILKDTRDLTPQSLPVIVFLHSDWIGMGHGLEELVAALQESSVIVFGIKDKNVADRGEYQFKNGAIFRYLAAETGGQYFNPPPDHYSDALADILLQLHSRFQLGFKSPVPDGKVHQLTIKLTKAAQKQHDSVRLRSRAAFVPKP